MQDKIENFESKLKKVKEIIEKLSDESIPLDKGMILFKEGTKELKEAGKMLESAKIEFQTIENEFLKEIEDD